MSHLRTACLLVLSLLLAGPAGATEPGSPITIQPAPRSRPVSPPPAPPAPRSVELPRFLESPGHEEPYVRLWLRFNREAHALELGARDFLETLGRFSAESRTEFVFPHEHVQLDAEVIAADQELVNLEEARRLLLDELGRSDPDHALLDGELPPPWSPEGRIDRDALVGLAFARSGKVAPPGPAVDRLLGRLSSVDRRLASLELQLLPAAEEALGAALIALSSGEASLLEVVNGLRFLKLQQRARLELRTQRELLLLELARRVDCTVEQLPWASVLPEG
jgi:hypothetical protein